MSEIEVTQQLEVSVRLTQGDHELTWKATASSTSTRPGTYEVVARANSCFVPRPAIAAYLRDQADEIAQRLDAGEVDLTLAVSEVLLRISAERDDFLVLTWAVDDECSAELTATPVPEPARLVRELADLIGAEFAPVEMSGDLREVYVRPPWVLTNLAMDTTPQS